MTQHRFDWQTTSIPHFWLQLLARLAEHWRGCVLGVRDYVVYALMWWALMHADAMS